MSVDNYNNLTGLEKVAIILLSINADNVARIFAMMEDDEIKEISRIMTTLGSVKPEIIERIIYEFTSEISDSSSFVGNLENTERLLEAVLGKDKVSNIMEDIRGPAGRNTWDKLSNVNEDILASYLRNEYPQTVALILTKIHPSHASKVLGVLPEDFSLEVIMRMLSMDSVKKEVLDGIERTLRAEFINNLSKTQSLDSNELMAEIFNNFDRQNEAKFMGFLEERDPGSAERIKELMFTFEDLINLDSGGIQVLMRNIDRDKLPTALKGANDKIKELFISNMSTRAASILKEDMEALGPVRLREVDEAQASIVLVAKDLASKGEIVIETGSEADELIY